MENEHRGQVSTTPACKAPDMETRVLRVQYAKKFLNLQQVGLSRPSGLLFTRRVHCPFGGSIPIRDDSYPKHEATKGISALKVREALQTELLLHAGHALQVFGPPAEAVAQRRPNVKDAPLDMSTTTQHGVAQYSHYTAPFFTGGTRTLNGFTPAWRHRSQVSRTLLLTEG